MSNIKTMNELRDEIHRVRQQSDFRKAEIKNTYNRFKSSLTPLNLIISIMGELKQEKIFQSAFGAFEKVREYLRKR